MGKFDNILKSYLTEEGTPQVNQSQLDAFGKALKQVTNSNPQAAAAAGNIANELTGTTSNDPQHPAIDAWNNLIKADHFNSLDANHKDAIMDVLTKKGVLPTNDKSKTETPTANTTENASSTSTGNPTSDMGLEGSGGN